MSEDPTSNKQSPVAIAADTSQIKRTKHYTRTHSSTVTLLKSYPENLANTFLRQQKKLSALRFYVPRVIGVALALLMVVQVIPFNALASKAEDSVSSQALSGWKKLEQADAALKTQDYQNARQLFSQAEQNFQATDRILRQTGQASLILPYLSGSSNYSTAQALLLTAIDIAKAGGETAVLMQNLQSSLHEQPKHLPSDDPFANISEILQTILNNSSQNRQHADAIAAYAHDAETVMFGYASKRVSNPDLEKMRLTAWQKMPAFVYGADTTSSLLANLPSLLGAGRNRRYLILFQNNNELRPSGGFLGSFGTTILKDGKVDGFAVETNIYKRDETFSKVGRIAAPYPLTKLTPDWFMRDANWDVDFTESMKRTAWFYKQEGGVDVDGVLAIDSSLIVELLKITGPIEIPKQNITMTADNFVEQAIYKSEREYLTNASVNAANEPKTFIADMFPLLLKKLSQSIQDNPTPVMHLLGTMIQEKHLLFAPFFAEGQTIVAKTHLDNALPVGDDFLLISNSNIGGLKSSLHIDQNVTITIEPTSHNTLLHTVHITRTHTGTYTWPDGDNHNYIRLAIPKDARYLESSSSGAEPDILETDADIDVHDTYQTIGRWLTTPVGSNRDATFSYETAVNSTALGSKMYYFHYVKQPGWTSDNLRVSFKDANGWAFHTDQPIYANRAQKANAEWVLPLSR